MVAFSLTLSGTVDAFDAEAFKASLADVLGNGIEAGDITLEVTSASVLVAASVKASSTNIADHVQMIVESASTVDLSVYLGVTVEAKTLPTVTLTYFDAPSPLESNGMINGAMIGGIVGGCFVPVLMCLLWMGNAFAPKCPSPCAASSSKPADLSGAGGVVMTTTNDKSAAAAASESAI